MRHPVVRRPLSRLGLTLTLLAGPALLTGAAPATGSPPTAPAAPPGRSAAGPVAVLLELATEPVAPAWRRAGDEARRNRRSPEAVRGEAARAAPPNAAAPPRRWTAWPTPSTRPSPLPGSSTAPAP